MIKLPKVVDTTGGAVSATYAVDDTTASVKDDLAVLCAVYNAMVDTIKALEKRLAVLES